MSFEFNHSTRIVFGRGCAGALPDEVKALGGSRVLLVSDPGVVAAGLAAPLLDALDGAGVAASLFTSVSPNPRDAECRAAADAALAAGAHAVVGLGGGSAMDVAKSAAALATNGGTVKDWEDPRRLERAPLPCLCLPTTAGTGSEVTFVAVITDEERQYKMTLLDRRLAPDVAIVDSELTRTLPPALTAATGIDALTHAIEAYTCRAATPVTDLFALRAAALIAGGLERAVADGDDMEAREQVLLGSTLAGIAFGNSDVGAVHCLGESLSGLYDTPHGVANAVFLAEVLAFNVPADPARHATLARALGVDTAGMDDEAAGHAAAAWVADLRRRLGLPALRELPGVTPADFPRLAEMAAAHVCSPDNAREASTDDYLALLQEAWGPE